jgi:hypothetical protein
MTTRSDELDLPLESYAAGLDEMVGKIVNLQRDYPANWEQRIPASFEGLGVCDFTVAELQILLAIAIDRLAVEGADASRALAEGDWA